MEKRALLAAALSLAVLVLWSRFFAPPPRNPGQQIQQQQRMNEQRQAEEQPISKEEKPLYEKDLNAPEAQEAFPSEQNLTEQKIEVKTELYHAVFTTLGATAIKWDLNKYTDDFGKPIRLIRPASGVLPPMSIVINDTRADLPSKVIYSTDRNSVEFDGNNTQSLTFTYKDKSGLLIKKSFTFYFDSYRIDMAVTVKGAPSYQLAIGDGFGIPNINAAAMYTHVGPSLLQGTSREAFSLSDLDEGTLEFNQDVRWIAQEDKYFTAALKPESGRGAAQVWKNGEKLEIAYTVNDEDSKFTLYAGPKQYDMLKQVGLQDIVNFGFWSFIAHPLFWFLKLLYKVTGNYGVSIILISILTRIPFIPLMNKSQKSMKKMQELNPKLQELKQKYKNDSKKIQTETMKLYKEAGVNPVSGCLPMVLQIPVFFALYKVLLISIELRQAPFVAWLTDLSAPDTLFGHFPEAIPFLGGSALGILPIIMGATMFLQQKLTPNPSSGQQAAQMKMMKYLPIIFTFMFFNLSSGLVLYWTVGNILGIIQQLFTNRKAVPASAEAQ